MEIKFIHILCLSETEGVFQFSFFLSILVVPFGIDRSVGKIGLVKDVPKDALDSYFLRVSKISLFNYLIFIILS